MAEVKKEPFVLIVEVTSICQNEKGEQVEVQELLLKERSADDATHVLKNFHVTDSINQAMHELAEAAGYVTSLGKKGK